MKTKKYRLRTWTACAALVLASQVAHAATSTPHIFGDNMVLQRNIAVPVWGWARPGEVVTVTFANQTQKTTADKDGKWMVRLDAMPANKIGQDLVITGENTITYKNVLMGDVWLCSGQSNMEFGLGNSLNGGDEVRAANYPMIQFIHPPSVTNAYPQTDFNANWKVISPKTAEECTAVGYFFARELFKELDVPIGLIHDNWGGTSIEPWLSRAGLERVPELKGLSQLVDNTYPDTAIGQQRFQEYLAQMKEWLPRAEQAMASKVPPPPLPNSPGLQSDSGQVTCIFNSKIAPLIPFALRGTLWYQGESNGGDGDIYMHKMEALIGGWRQLWGQGVFPFYWVQLANFQHSDPNKPEMGDGWAGVRDAQRKALAIPNTGMAVIIDIGDADDVHPKDKQDVGKRLAAWALAKDYGKAIEYSGPLYQNATAAGNKMRITFSHADGGLMIGEKSGLEPVRVVPDGKMKWISIAGADKKFYWADAVIDGKTLVVSSDQVAQPVAVRCAFTANPVGPLLYNKAGFPASPFRTDDW